MLGRNLGIRSVLNTISFTFYWQMWYLVKGVTEEMKLEKRFGRIWFIKTFISDFITLMLNRCWWTISPNKKIISSVVSVWYYICSMNCNIPVLNWRFINLDMVTTPSGKDLSYYFLCNFWSNSSLHFSDVFNLLFLYILFWTFLTIVNPKKRTPETYN